MSIRASRSRRGLGAPATQRAIRTDAANFVFPGVNRTELATWGGNGTEGVFGPISWTHSPTLDRSHPAAGAGEVATCGNLDKSAGRRGRCSRSISPPTFYPSRGSDTTGVYPTCRYLDELPRRSECLSPRFSYVGASPAFRGPVSSKTAVEVRASRQSLEDSGRRPYSRLTRGFPPASDSAVRLHHAGVVDPTCNLSNVRSCGGYVRHQHRNESQRKHREQSTILGAAGSRLHSPSTPDCTKPFRCEFEPVHRHRRTTHRPRVHPLAPRCIF